jgi:hypothetical protein
MSYFDCVWFTFVWDILDMEKKVKKFNVDFIFAQWWFIDMYATKK